MRRSDLIAIANDAYNETGVGTRELYPIGYMGWGWREVVR